MRSPSWADTWGHDEFGLWAGFVIGDVEQRMRLIPDGKYQIGSPETERGRYDDESLHEAKLEAYWMAETPVTQALYAAVTGDSPNWNGSTRVPWSCLDRPVEQVSWEDAERFCGRVEELRPGLHLRLPSEAEWETACRGGKVDATYFGDLDDPGFQSNVVDRLGWYGGNSMKGFELESGLDFRGLWKGREGMFPPPGLAGTHPVRRKAANALGFYDMLGNVWEWCSDLWEAGAGGDERASERVVRGGSWIDPARRCRSACRLGRVASDRSGDMGFRVSRGLAESVAVRDDAKRELPPSFSSRQRG